MYGSGHNEELIGRAIRGRRQQAVISVKFGALREPGGALVGFDARSGTVKSFLTYTLRRLGTDHVDIYRPAKVGPTVPTISVRGRRGSRARTCSGTSPSSRR